jgi:NADP-dependent 3-hydroxy acid dehydrogenase YdfG
MKNTFEDEVVYITGASAGIGYATAELCLKYGATVVITGRNKDNLDKAKQELLNISSNVVAHNVDVSIESEIEDSLEEIYKSFGKVDGLINNAPSIHTGKIVDLRPCRMEEQILKQIWMLSFLQPRTVLPWMHKSEKQVQLLILHLLLV